MKDDQLDFGSAFPEGVTPLPVRSICRESVDLLEALLRDAKLGKIAGLAVVVLRSDDTYQMRLRGAATKTDNQMYLAGTLAALQKMVLELGP